MKCVHICFEKVFASSINTTWFPLFVLLLVPLIGGLWSSKLSLFGSSSSRHDRNSVRITLQTNTDTQTEGTSSLQYSAQLSTNQCARGACLAHFSPACRREETIHRCVVCSLASARPADCGLRLSINGVHAQSLLVHIRTEDARGSNSIWTCSARNGRLRWCGVLWNLTRV